MCVRVPRGLRTCVHVWMNAAVESMHMCLCAYMQVSVHVNESLSVSICMFDG